MKLYRVTCIGCSLGKYKSPFVLANDMNDAAKITEDYLNKHEIGSSAGRKVECVELIADDYKYGDVLPLLHREATHEGE